MHNMLPTRHILAHAGSFQTYFITSPVGECHLETHHWFMPEMSVWSGSASAFFWVLGFFSPLAIGAVFPLQPRPFHFAQLRECTNFSQKNQTRRKHAKVGDTTCKKKLPYLQLKWPKLKWTEIWTFFLVGTGSKPPCFLISCINLKKYYSLWGIVFETLMRNKIWTLVDHSAKNYVPKSYQ